MFIRFDSSIATMVSNKIGDPEMGLSKGDEQGDEAEQ